MIRVYGIGTTRSLRVHWALKEAGVEYETMPIMAGSEESKSDEFRKINLTSRIPAADFNGHQLTESCAIIKYIGNQYDKNLSGRSIKENSKIDEWLCFLLSEIDSHTLYVIDKHVGELSDIFGKSPEATETAVNGFNEHIVKLDCGLLNNDFLVGKRLTLADIMAVTCLIWAKKLVKYGLEIPESCLKYADKIMERPEFKESWNINYAYKKK